MPVVDASPQPTIEAQQHALTVVPRKIRWKNDQRKRVKRRTPVHTANASPGNDEAPFPALCIGSAGQMGELASTVSNERLEDADGVDDVVDRTYDKGLVRTPDAFVIPWIAPINAQSRMLMSHCEPYLSSVSGGALLISNSRGPSCACYGRIGHCQRLPRGLAASSMRR